MTNSNTYDVAVVGGGLAGLSLAIQCAGAGNSVVLFERDKYPFHKVCGEYISMESYPFLERLGVGLQAMQLPVINQLCVTSMSGKPFHFPLPLGGFGVSRFLLDHSLYELALAKGVVVYEETKVQDISFQDDVFTVHTPGKTIRAKVAAGAFGKRSNIDVKWNRPFISRKNSGKNYIAVKYHIQYDHDPAQIVLHNFEDGYCGMSSIEAGKSCLCYLATAAQLKRSGNSIRQLQQNILYKNPRLRDVFSSATFLYDEPLAISQVSFARKAAVENHVLMMGDAAGLITPLCGNGMSMAMHASKIAFETIQEFLSGRWSRHAMETAYTARWKRQFSLRLAAGRTIQKVFGEPITTSVFLNTMELLPPLSKALIRATHGRPF